VAERKFGTRLCVIFTTDSEMPTAFWFFDMRTGNRRAMRRRSGFMIRFIYLHYTANGVIGQESQIVATFQRSAGFGVWLVVLSGV